MAKKPVGQIKRGELHGATVVSLCSPQHITINPLSVLQAARLNNSNKKHLLV